MLERLRANLLKGAAPQSNPHLTLKEHLSIDRSIRDDLGVSSLVVIEDSKLPDTCPWKFCRRATRDGESGFAMSAEIRISPALAHQSISLDSSCHAHLRQMRAVFPYIVKETGGQTTQVSLDTTLPYSKPYQCVNLLDADDRLGIVTSVVISSHLASQLEQPTDPSASLAVRHFASDLRVLATRAVVVRPAEAEGMLEVFYSRFDRRSYRIEESVKRVIDVFMPSLQLFDQDARCYDPHPQSLLDPLLYNAIALHRIRDSSQFEEGELNIGERYEHQQRLLEQQASHEENLASAKEATRRFFGNDILETLLFAVDHLKGDVGEAIAYFRDFDTIHGYRFWQHEERLRYLFDSHPLCKRIAAHNQACRDRQASDTVRDTRLMEPETLLFLQFRLSSTDIRLAPHAEVVLSSPYEQPGNSDHNERLVCVTLTPKALKLLLNAKSPHDETIQPLLQEIDRAMERILPDTRNSA